MELQYARLKGERDRHSRLRVDKIFVGGLRMKHYRQKFFALVVLVAAQTASAAEVTETPHKIAYISWGSLLANPGSLPLEEAEGFTSHPQKGPLLPIEYARKSNDGRITSVIAPNFGLLGKEPFVRDFMTYYATFRGNDVSQARAALQAREGTSSENIGYVDLQEGTYRRKEYNPTTGAIEVKKGTIGDTYYTSSSVLRSIADWARENNYTAVIWTDLPATFTKKDLTLPHLKAHLDTLDKEALKRAYCFFKITPDPIRRGTRFGEPLMKYAQERLQDFFEEKPQEYSIQQCKDTIYQQR